MPNRKGGMRRKTRQKMRKHFRRKGKLSISSYFQTFEEGDKVVLMVEPAYQKGMYHPRYMGRVGIISGKRGACYEIDLRLTRKAGRVLFVHPIHLKKA